MMRPIQLLPVAIMFLLPATIHGQSHTMPETLRSFITDRVSEFDQIPEERKTQLADLAAFVQSRAKANEPVKLTFICTHNSRRSHMAQIWASVAAAHYGIEKVETFSGGTEATEFNKNAVAALGRSGLKIEKSSDEENPHYMVTYSDQAKPLDCFSKVFDQQPNPTTDFGAVMVCSSADKACPNVSGADQRYAIPFVDPKISDGTDQQDATYDERNRQIAREMLFVMSQAS